MSLKNKLISFGIAFVVCGGGFLLLDVTLMNMQGLSLIFER